MRTELAYDKSLAAEAAARGAALLDDKMPGWEMRIDLSTLDLKDDCRCVLGQLTGDYIDGCDVLDLDMPSDLGFNVRGKRQANGVYWFPYSFTELDEAWIDLIKARHDAGFPAGSLSSSSGLVQR